MAAYDRAWQRSRAVSLSRRSRLGAVEKSFETFFHSTNTCAVSDESQFVRAASFGAVFAPSDRAKLRKKVLSHDESEETPINAALEYVNGHLEYGDCCVLVCELDKSDSGQGRERMLALVSNKSSTRAVGLAIARHGRFFQVEMVIPISRACKLMTADDGSFLLHTAKAAYKFRPASVLSLWSTVSVINSMIEGSDVEGSKQLAEHYSLLIRGAAGKTFADCVRPADEKGQLLNAAMDKEGIVEADFIEDVKRRIRKALSEADLDSVSGKQIREILEADMKRSLKEHKKFINEFMMVALGQMTPASQILDTLFLGTEWNASNKDELLQNNCRYVLNVTKEIPCFFPEQLKYHQVHIDDEPHEDLLTHLNAAVKYIESAVDAGSSVLVHCKMGVSRSASTVIAYIMKRNSLSREDALAFVKERRDIVKPNSGFWDQLGVYEGILRANRTKRLSSQASKTPATVGDVLSSVSPGYVHYEAAISKKFRTPSSLMKADAQALQSLGVPRGVSEHLVSELKNLSLSNSKR